MTPHMCLAFNNLGQVCSSMVAVKSQAASDSLPREGRLKTHKMVSLGNYTANLETSSSSLDRKAIK